MAGDGVCASRDPLGSRHYVSHTQTRPRPPTRPDRAGEFEGARSPLIRAGAGAMGKEEGCRHPFDAQALAPESPNALA